MKTYGRNIKPRILKAAVTFVFSLRASIFHRLALNFNFRICVRPLPVIKKIPHNMLQNKMPVNGTREPSLFY